MKLLSKARECNNFLLSSRRRRALLLVLLVICLSAERDAQSSAPHKSVLVLYWYNKDFPGNVLFDQTFQTYLNSAGERVEYYAEYLESNRFPGEAQAQVLADYLHRKYSDRRIDVVVAVADASTDFLLEYRSYLFPKVPLVFVAIKRRTAAEVSAGPGMTGIVPANTHKQTINLALKLHPDTQQLFVVSGTPEHDKRFEVNAQLELKDYADKVKITYLTDLPLQELIEKTRALPPHSIILYAWQQSLDPKGELLETWQTLKNFAPSSSAPIYGMGSVNVGYGLVGGYVVSSEANGTKVAEIALQILNGKRAQDIPIENAPALAMFDWRELQRWGISEQSLPVGSVIRFRELTFWELYKWRIIGIVGLFLVQTAFIAGLLIERKRRRRANESLDRLNTELEERIRDRTAALKAKSQELETFAYSVAHDLKAPLRGIDGYSRLLLQDHFESLNSEGRSFLNTIQSSSEEMRQLIDDLLAYSRLERRDFKTDHVELRPLIARLIEHVTREPRESSIDFVVDVNGSSVVADVNGLSQALGNYIENAIKFTQKVAKPRIEIGAKEKGQVCLLWVKDNGIGFDPKYGDRIFDIFQRLNQPEDYPGTGVGLAIVRKAVERMGGRAWAESKPMEGATFYLEIPKSNGARLTDE